MPANFPPLTLAVNDKKQGPLRIALAHENQHVEDPTLASAEMSREWNGEFALPPNPKDLRSPGCTTGTPRSNMGGSGGNNDSVSPGGIDGELKVTQEVAPLMFPYFLPLTFWEKSIIITLGGLSETTRTSFLNHL